MKRTKIVACFLVIVALVLTMMSSMAVTAHAESTTPQTIKKIKVQSEGQVDRKTGYIHFTITGEGFTEYHRNEYATAQAGKQVEFSADVILVADDGYVFDKGWTLTNTGNSQLNAYLYRVYDKLFDGIENEVYSGEPETEVGKVAVIKVSGRHNQPIGQEESSIVFDESNTPEQTEETGRRPSTPVSTNPPTGSNVPAQPTQPPVPTVQPTQQPASYRWEKRSDGWYYTNGTQDWVGWLVTSNATYYLSENGRMFTGWKSFGESVYYFAPNGQMAKGFTEIDGFMYLFDTTTGMMHTGWYTDPDTRDVYYFHKNLTNAVVVEYKENSEVEWYRKEFPVGSMATCEWLKTINPNGGYINYYLLADGKLARDMTLGEYYVDEYGRNFADSIVIR